MRSSLLLLLLAAACSKNVPCEDDAAGPDCSVRPTDTGGTDAGDTGADDTAEPGDTAHTGDVEEILPVVAYAPASVAFERDDIDWTALSGEEDFVVTVNDDTYGGDHDLTIGFEVEGSSELALAATSVVVEADGGPWTQTFEGVVDGATLTPHLELDVPIEVDVFGTTISINSLLPASAGALQFTHDYDPVSADALAFAEEGQGAGWVHAFAAETWTYAVTDVVVISGVAPVYADLELEADITLTSSWSTSSIDSESEEGEAWGTQTTVDGALDLSARMPEELPETMAFRSVLHGELSHEVRISGSIEVTVHGLLLTDTTETFDFDVTLEDDEAFAVAFPELTVSHDGLDASELEPEE